MNKPEYENMRGKNDQVKDRKAPILTFIFGSVLLASAAWDFYLGYLDDWYGMNWHGLEKISLTNSPTKFWLDVGCRFVFGVLLLIAARYGGLHKVDD